MELKIYKQKLLEKRGVFFFKKKEQYIHINTETLKPIDPSDWKRHPMEFIQFILVAFEFEFVQISILTQIYSFTNKEMCVNSGFSHSHCI